MLKKKWHGIPVAIVSALLLLVLVSSSVFAAPYAFKTFTTAVTVDEPMSVEYNLNGAYGGDNDWHPLGDDDSLDIAGSAGDVFLLDLRFLNRASQPLKINTVISGGGDGDVTGEGFPEDEVIVGGAIGDPSDWRVFPVSIVIQGTAAPRLYNVTFSFTRENVLLRPSL